MGDQINPAAANWLTASIQKAEYHYSQKVALVLYIYSFAEYDAECSQPNFSRPSQGSGRGEPIILYISTCSCISCINGVISACPNKVPYGYNSYSGHLSQSRSAKHPLRQETYVDHSDPSHFYPSSAYFYQPFYFYISFSPHTKTYTQVVHKTESHADNCWREKCNLPPQKKPLQSDKPYTKLFQVTDDFSLQHNT